MTVLKTKGVVTDQIQKAICGQRDMDILEQWLLLAVKAEGVEEFRKQAGI